MVNEPHVHRSYMLQEILAVLTFDYPFGNAQKLLKYKTLKKHPLKIENV